MDGSGCNRLVELAIFKGGFWMSKLRRLCSAMSGRADYSALRSCEEPISTVDDMSYMICCSTPVTSSMAIFSIFSLAFFHEFLTGILN